MTKEQDAKREYVRPEERARKQSIYPLTVGMVRERSQGFLCGVRPNGLPWFK